MDEGLHAAAPESFSTRIREAILFIAPPIFVPPPQIDEQYLKGRLWEYYAALRPGGDELGKRIARGDLVTDVRLRDAMAELRFRQRRMAA